MNARDFSKLTIRHAQVTQPWTIPYSATMIGAVEANDGLGHLMGTHAVLHAQKTLGQIAAVFEAMDHTGLPPTQGQVDEIAGKSADLLTAALRLANLYGFDLAQVLVERSEEKNRVTLPAWEGQESDPTATFLSEVRAELMRARAKFPGDRIMTLAMAEEAGELVKAVLDEPASAVRKEAVQVATMAARVVLDGDGSVNAWRSERGLDPLVADA